MQRLKTGNRVRRSSTDRRVSSTSCLNASLTVRDERIVNDRGSETYSQNMEKWFRERLDLLKAQGSYSEYAIVRRITCDILSDF